MKTRQLSIINYILLMVALLLFQGTLSLARGAQPEEVPSAKGTLHHPDQPRLVVRLGHSGSVTSVCFSPDGRYVLTGSRDQTARLWDAATGKEVREFEGHAGEIGSVAFSPDGRYVLTGSWDKTARLWDREIGKEVRRFEGHVTNICSVAFSPDGRHVLTGSGDETLRFNGETGFVLSRSADETARLWDRETGQEVRRFEGHAYAVFSVAFSPNGRYVLTGSWDKTARLWDRETGKEVRRFEGHANAIRSVAFSPDGRYVLTGSLDETARLWDRETGKEVRRFEGDEDDKYIVSSVAFSPDGGYVLTGSWDKTARLWDRETGKEVRRFEGHANAIRSVAFSPDGRYVLTGSRDKTARLWDRETGKEMRKFEGHSDAVLSVAFSPDGGYVLTGSWDKTARLWDRETGKEVRRFEGHAYLITSVAFSPDGRYVLTGSWDKTARLWDRETGNEVRKFEGHANFILSVAFSPDGRYVMAGSTDKTARLWDRETGKEMRKFEGHSDAVLSVAFSPDGGYVLTGSWDKTARLWDLENGNEVRKFEGHSDYIASVTISVDGRYVLTGSFDKTARLWDRKTGKEVRKFEGHAGGIGSVAFSPDDRYVLTGSWDSTSRLWDAMTGKELARMISFRDGTWAVVTPDGRFDTNNLEEIKGLHWIMPDDPMRPLPVEIFMRDYYEPRLLARALAREQFKPIRSLTELNRVQPKAEITRIAPEDVVTGTVTVTVEVSGDSSTFERDGKKVAVKTGVYDLRLFRDGQLVAQMPSPAYEPSSTKVSWEEQLGQWRGAQKIIDFETGKKTLTFRGIRLPRRTGLKDVEFSAYAFNEDRVKSATARTRFPIPKDISPRQGRAYVITVGVNAYESADWDLRYAAKDAQYFSDIVKPLLEKTKNYTSVVLVRLISDWTRDPTGKRKVVSSNATKSRFKAVLDLLAGRKVEPGLRFTIPNGEKLQAVGPEDLVLIAFSSHGYADQLGTFYLFPYDIGSHAGEKVSSELLKRTISSDELSNWMREIDAGEMVMVIDACHSAASVEGTGFKPGPMGARGLGQLAYDKGMRILASTRADDVAWESPLTRQGLLSYALVQNGLVKKQADFDPKDKRILLSEWLKYGVKRVPELYEEVRSGQAKGTEGKVAKLTAYRRGVVRVEKDAGKKTQVGVQQPSLFDFRRAVPYEPLITRLGD